VPAGPGSQPAAAVPALPQAVLHRTSGTSGIWQAGTSPSPAHDILTPRASDALGSASVRFLGRKPLQRMKGAAKGTIIPARAASAKSLSPSRSLKLEGPRGCVPPALHACTHQKSKPPAAGSWGLGLKARREGGSWCCVDGTLSRVSSRSAPRRSQLTPDGHPGRGQRKGQGKRGGGHKDKGGKGADEERWG